MNAAPSMSAQAPKERVAGDPMPDEQARYARWLQWGTRVGLALLLLSFAVYLTGLVPSHVPRRHLPELWSLPVGEYLRRTGTSAGWGWLALIGHGDVANLIGIAVLASCSLPALFSLVPLYAARGDRVYAGLCIVEAAVLAFAASGIVGAGH